MESKTLILLTAALVIVIGFLALNHRKDRDLTNSQESPRILSSDSPSETTPVSPEKAERILAWSQSERKAFLKRLPLEVKDGKANVKVSVSLLKRCEPGDLDAIRLDFNKDRQKRLKIGFENLENDREAYFSELPDNFFEKNKFEFQFSIPVSDTPAQYGFFVCSNKNAEKCSEKEFKEINDIFVEHHNNKEYTPKDRLYFFQYALIDSRGIAVFGIHPKGDEPFQAIETYVQERGVSSLAAKTVLEKSKKWTHLLGSLPVKFTGTSVELEIPQYSKEACEGEQK